VEEGGLWAVEEDGTVGWGTQDAVASRGWPLLKLTSVQLILRFGPPDGLSL